MKAYIADKDIIQNLIDAGCSKKQVKELITLYKDGKKDKIYKIMEKHRNNILNDVHKSEKN